MMIDPLACCFWSQQGHSVRRLEFHLGCD